jgi:hypothetical protein
VSSPTRSSVTVSQGLPAPLPASHVVVKLVLSVAGSAMSMSQVFLARCTAPPIVRFQLGSLLVRLVISSVSGGFVIRRRRLRRLVGRVESSLGVPSILCSAAVFVVCAYVCLLGYACCPSSARPSAPVLTKMFRSGPSLSGVSASCAFVALRDSAGLHQMNIDMDSLLEHTTTEC